MQNIEWTIPENQSSIKLGSRVRDRITGFEGIAVARVEYLTGCTQYGITPTGSGEVKGSEYLDWQRLEYDRSITELHKLANSQVSLQGNGPSDPPGRNKMAPSR